jgi:hypothetical protein
MEKQIGNFEKRVLSPKIFKIIKSFLIMTLKSLQIHLMIKFMILKDIWTQVVQKKGKILNQKVVLYNQS